MNKIRINRLLLAGLATLIVFIAVELFVEQMIGRVLLGDRIDLWYQSMKISRWNLTNYFLNILIALLNSTLMIWLYASLRPMFGVGYKTALVASAILIILAISMTLNGINIGLFPAQIGLHELIYEAIELPIAMIAGALVYEGSSDAVPV